MKKFDQGVSKTEDIKDRKYSSKDSQTEVDEQIDIGSQLDELNFSRFDVLRKDETFKKLWLKMHSKAKYEFDQQIDMSFSVSNHAISPETNKELYATSSRLLY